MDPLQSLINQEAARRGIGSSGTGSAFDDLFGGGARPTPLGGGSQADGMGGGVSPMGISAKSPAPSLSTRLVEGALGLIPRVGMAARIVNAGPTADGTLDHARKMGWYR